MDQLPQAGSNLQGTSPQPIKPKKSHKKLWLVIIIIIVLGFLGLGFWYHHHSTKKVSDVSITYTKNQIQGLQLNTSKDYGNKYADGILPVGDSKYVTSGPKKGYIYACSQYAQSLATSQGGAMTPGPWFMDDDKEYDVNKKLHVEGDVMWQAEFSDVLNGNTRTIVTNDLPSQPTGIFPIATTDPAYAYDHNPNSIKGQHFVYNLSADPTYGSPHCMTGESGIMLTGVALFDGLDAGGRDAGAWEVQDNCDGHPQSDGIYHYHTLSSCIKNTSVHTVIGYALDGFPITGPVVGPSNILTTDDLDECHGITSEIDLDGKDVTMYHYVMTEDYPYSVSCFRGQPITPPDLQQYKQSSQVGPTSGSQTGQNSNQQPPPPPSQ